MELVDLPHMLASVLKNSTTKLTLKAENDTFASVGRQVDFISMPL